MESFGPYELTGRIAMGGMAEIFRARKVSDAGFTKTLVIKRVLPHYADDNSFVSMFIDEAVLAAKLNHPNIVSTIDFGQVGGTYFIALEFVEGFDLRRLQKFAHDADAPFGPNRSVQIGIGMCRGLGHAHERSENGIPLGIVHRDVSPHNVLVSMTGDIKVMDFGIAKAMARATKTSTGIIKGKIGYMAPEQALGEMVGPAADMYATGIVLWELLAQRRAFSGDNEMEVLRRVQLGQLPSLKELAPDTPDSLVQVIGNMTARDPAERYPRMRDAERALMRVLHEVGGEDAARLEEFLGEIVPSSAQNVLRESDPREAAGTQSLDNEHAPTSPETPSAPRVDDAAVTHLLEPGNAPTTVSARSTLIPTTPGGQTPAPTRANQVRSRAAAYTGLALGVLLTGSVIFAAFRKPPPIVHEIIVEPQPPPTPVVTTAAGQTQAATASAPTSPLAGPPSSGEESARTPPTRALAQKERKAGAPPRRDPKAIPKTENVDFTAEVPAGPSVAFLRCPFGSVLYEGGVRLGELRPRNVRRFPVKPGTHKFSLKLPSGQMIELSPVSVVGDESEMLECP